MIDSSIEQTLSSQEWKDGSFVSKTISFLTSSALAWGLLIIFLAATYIALKMPPLAPQTETFPAVPTVAPIEYAKPMVKSANPTASKPVATDLKLDAPAMPKKKQTEPETQFDRDLANFERKL
jgi:hypothetical protein